MQGSAGKCTGPAARKRLVDPGQRPIPYLQDNFLLGLKQYLEQHAYNSTRATDVWTALSAPLGFDVPAAMMTWTYQPGYPLVTATVDDRRRVWLHQAPFSLQGAAACDPNTAWWIPIRRALAGLAGWGGRLRLDALGSLKHP